MSEWKVVHLDGTTTVCEKMTEWLNNLWKIDKEIQIGSGVTVVLKKD